MSFKGILIANRGEIAIRIARAAAALGIRSVAVFSENDKASLHTRIADEAVLLPGIGAPAHLDMQQVIAAAKANGCDAIRPGYGFLSEQSAFAEQCAAAGITFIGPKVEHLKLFGDKGAARAAALFYLRGIAPPGIDLRVIYRGVVPFIVIQLIGLVVIYQWEALVTWLPAQAYGIQ